MFKRVTWMTVGAAAGAVGTLWTQRKVRAQAERFTPPAIADAARQRAVDVRDHLVTAVREGRDTSRTTEDELRRRLDDRLRGRTG